MLLWAVARECEAVPRAAAGSVQPARIGIVSLSSSILSSATHMSRVGGTNREEVVITRAASGSRQDMLRMIHESAEAARLGKQVKSEAGESFEMSLRVAKEKAILAEQEQMRRHNMSGQQSADSARSPKESEAAAASKRPSATWAQRVSNLAARAWRSYGIAVLIVVLAACAS